MRLPWIDKGERLRGQTARPFRNFHFHVRSQITSLEERVGIPYIVGISQASINPLGGPGIFYTIVGITIVGSTGEDIFGLAVIGDAERDANQVAVRLRGNENLGSLPVEGFIQRLLGEISSRA